MQLALVLCCDLSGVRDVHRILPACAVWDTSAANGAGAVPRGWFWSIESVTPKPTASRAWPSKFAPMSNSVGSGRQNLPIPDTQWVGVTTFDAKDPDTKFPPIEQVRPPEGAPNVLIVLLDDVGFGASSAFGGPCYTRTSNG